MRKYATASALVACLSSGTIASAQELGTFNCTVSEKFDKDGHHYSKDELRRWQFGVKITYIFDSKQVILQRCSYSTQADAVTCDSYNADRRETDKSIAVEKYYYFKGQYDVQIFPNGAFVENNGRGGISFGVCRVE